MGTGATSYKPLRRKTDIVGEELLDPFFDSYKEEGFCCGDILRLIDNCPTDLVRFVIDKRFLKKIVHSHLLRIKELENYIGTNNANRH